MFHALVCVRVHELLLHMQLGQRCIRMGVLFIVKREQTEVEL